MKIDWKEVAASPGYISMKAAVANEAKRTAKWGRKPDERYAQCFNFAINRAKHYALHIEGVIFVNMTYALITILNDWEDKRDYSFINYYSDYNFPKFHSGNKKLLGVRGQIKGYRKDRFYRDPKKRQKRILLLLVGQQKAASKKAKPRWTSEYKEHKKRLGY